jgi:hypothetical protein
MTRTRLVLSVALLALLAGSAVAAPKKKKKGKKAKTPPAAEKAPDPEPTPTPTPEPTPEPAAATPEPAAATPPPETGGGAGGSVGMEATASGGGAAGDVSAKASAPGGWPQEIIDRPLTLAKGLLRFDVNLPIAKVVTVSGTPPVTSSSTGVLLGLGAGYGVSDKIELGATYAISLKEFEAKGPLEIFALYGIMNSEKMKAAPRAGFTYNLAGETGQLNVGLAFQYNLNKQMAVYMPGTHLRAVFIAPEVAGVAAPKPIDFSLPVGFAYQLNKNVYAFAQTSIATINISKSATAFIFADAIPLTVGAYYSLSNKMEFGAQIASGDVPSIGDNFAFAVVARMFMGDAVKGAMPPMAQTASTAPSM